MTIYERIRELRLAKQMSQYELAKKVGYEGRSAISKVENGERDISQSMIEKYAEALGVTPTYLLYGEDFPVIKDGAITPDNILPLPKHKKLPMLGTIACGEPIFAEENIDGYISCPDNIDADFCLRCKGDSMIGARIQDGDIVYIRQQPDV